MRLTCLFQVGNIRNIAYTQSLVASVKSKSKNMKQNITLLLLASLIILSCNKDKETADDILSPTTNNLVCNSSFEINGKGSLSCWSVVKDFIIYPDTFSTEAAPNGGNFSLRLEGTKDANWDPYAENYVTNISGQKIVSLSAYIMSVYGGQSIYLYLEHIRTGQVIKSKSYYDWAFNGWKKFSVTDTLTLQTQDSLRIKIIQTTGQNSGAYIDLVEMTAN